MLAEFESIFVLSVGVEQEAGKMARCVLPAFSKCLSSLDRGFER